MPVRRPWALATAVLGCAMLAIYIGIILGEGNDQIADVLPWALAMAIAAIAAVAGSFIKDVRIAKSLLIATAVLFAVLGAVSILTIGIGFLLTAALAAFSVTRLPASG